MIEFPDRLSGLISRIEDGPPVTQADVDRLAILQAIDVAKIGEEFARETIRQNSAATENYREVLNGESGEGQ